MTFQLSAEQEAVRARVREVADREISPHAARVDAAAEFPADGYQALVRSGLYATHIPHEYGGAAADAIIGALVIEETARACVSTSLVSSVTRLATFPLMERADVAIRERYLTAVGKDSALFAFALSEPEAGSDAAAMITTAVRDGDHYVLNGVKRWITQAGVADYYLVFAVTDPAARRVSALVVEKDEPGLSFGQPEDKMGLRGSPTAEVYFEDVRVPDNRLVGGEGDGLPIALNALDHSRVSIAAQAVGLAQGALDYAAGYLRDRRQFGRAVADFQGLRFMVATMAMKLEAARQLTYAAASRSQARDPSLRYFASAAKCFASDVAMEITTDAVQLLGGNGYIKAHPVERMMRDAKATQIYEGTNQIQRLVMARQLLG
jgi:alkylation response protein AidB-like acyl-CoA dehydrogenase